MNEKFAEAVRRLAKGKVATTTGKVTSVAGTTCVVEREGNLPPLEDVRLHAVDGGFEDVVLIVPAIGSEVLCLVVDGEEPETAIVKTTKVEKVLVSVGGAKVEISAGKVQLKNQNADLKEILTETLETLKNATILTPSGPGQFNAPEKAKFQQNKIKVNQLFD